jgi:RNA polymerase sigma-70 factor, ECF subfamily
MSLVRPEIPADRMRPLVSGVLAGDGHAIEQFIRAAGPAILRVVRQILGSHHPDVPDVVQDATFATIDALGRFRGESTVLHFVCRIAALTAMNARRRSELRERFVADLSALDALAGSEPSPFGLAVAVRRREAFRRLLDELPATQAEALIMHCVLGWTVEEAAETIGVPANTLRSRLMTARTVLRKKLSEDPELWDLLVGVS